ncbi:hypothetical protein QJS04_geneDACA000704 [Acorus gramineus]|uniref:Uncharacterized protein n=1 Tax=Acorus gramineus TaxID=55184 RepID=A0AAV9AR29_ACOGR|nr:hypothetical protein QJS04_geneDACA000704 [Acorus gramineus]
MQYLFEESGKRYLDAFAGIVTRTLLMPLWNKQSFSNTPPLYTCTMRSSNLRKP